MRLQKTIKKTVVLEGKGIHTGENVKLTIKKAPADTGIIFIRTDLKNRPAVTADVSNLLNYSDNRRCTSIEKSGTSIYTIEHLMAALSSLNIDNAKIEIDNRELPALDGSALDFTLALQKIGTVEQKKEKKELFLQDAIWCTDRDALLIAIPSENFSVSYIIKYDNLQFMNQSANFAFNSAKEKEDVFIKEIAPARTFCLESETANILEKGLGKGANYKNALVIRDGKPIENEFRFANEPARHKIVDLLGDLTLLNVEIKAHLIGIKSGHTLNEKLSRKLAKLL